MTKTFIGRMKDGSSAIFFGDSDSSLKTISEMFEFPKIEDCQEREFQIDYALGNDEWFFISLNEDERKEMIDDYLLVASSSADCNKVTPDQYNKLLTLYLIREKDKVGDIIFNRIFDRFYIKSKTFINVDISGPKIKTETNFVEFNHSVDAFWDGVKNKLYFKKYSTIKPLFLSIDKYYRSATKEEVESFLENDFFLVSAAFNKSKLGERALHNIAIILDSKEIDFSDVDVRKSYITYANEFKAFDVSIENGQFKVEKASDLTKILSVLQERLYVAPITKEKRVASSTSPIG